MAAPSKPEISNGDHHPPTSKHTAPPVPLAPARGANGYYRLNPNSAPPPPSTANTRMLNPSPSSRTSEQPHPSESDVRSMPLSAPRRSSGPGGEGRTGGERVIGGATSNNPVIGQRDTSTSSHRPSNGHSAGMTDGDGPGMWLRIGNTNLDSSMDQPMGGIPAGNREANGARHIPRSTTPINSPPRHKPKIRLGPGPKHSSYRETIASLPRPSEPLPPPPGVHDPRVPSGVPSLFHGDHHHQEYHRQEAAPLSRTGFPNAARAAPASEGARNGSTLASGSHNSQARPRRSQDRSIAQHASQPRPTGPPRLPQPTTNHFPIHQNAEAGPSSSTVDAGPSARDYAGDTIMQDADDGLVQEQRRSLRARAARSGLDSAGDVAGGGSEMSVIAGVSASGNRVKIGATTKIGTGPGGVQRKKKKGDLDVPNQDFCSSCRGVGKFLCCDGCPRSFHFMCLEPPLRIDELPDEETWYCKKCRDDFALDSARTDPTLPSPSPAPAGPSSVVAVTSTAAPRLTLKPIPQTFRMLVKRLDEDNPVQFRLPTDVRTFFAGMGEGPTGSYLEEVNSRRSDRKAIGDERDPVRVKDARSRHITCYVCGGSSVPIKSLLTDPEPSWRPTVSCDYCSLHWHIDCLSPPLPIVPNLQGKKWRCPNHVEQVMPPKRTIRAGVETIDITRLAMPNNGNIEVIPEPRRPQLEYEDLMVNKHKYRVPERIIQLDFFDRIKGRTRAVAPPSAKRTKRSGSDSSLTSLESGPASREDMDAADLIMGLSRPAPESRRNPAPTPARTSAPNGSQARPAGSAQKQGNTPAGTSRTRARHTGGSQNNDTMDVDEDAVLLPRRGASSRSAQNATPTQNARSAGVFTTQVGVPGSRPCRNPGPAYVDPATLPLPDLPHPRPEGWAEVPRPSHSASAPAQPEPKSAGEKKLDKGKGKAKAAPESPRPQTKRPRPPSTVPSDGSDSDDNDKPQPPAGGSKTATRPRQSGGKGRSNGNGNGNGNGTSNGASGSTSQPRADQLIIQPVPSSRSRRPPPASTSTPQPPSAPQISPPRIKLSVAIAMAKQFKEDQGK